MYILRRGRDRDLISPYQGLVWRSCGVSSTRRNKGESLGGSFYHHAGHSLVKFNMAPQHVVFLGCTVHLTSTLRLARKKKVQRRATLRCHEISCIPAIGNFRYFIRIKFRLSPTTIQRQRMPSALPCAHRPPRALPTLPVTQNITKLR